MLRLLPAVFSFKAHCCHGPWGGASSWRLSFRSRMPLVSSTSTSPTVCMLVLLSFELQALHRLSLLKLVVHFVRAEAVAERIYSVVSGHVQSRLMPDIMADPDSFLKDYFWCQIWYLRCSGKPGIAWLQLHAQERSVLQFDAEQQTAANLHLDCCRYMGLCSVVCVPLETDRIQV